MPRGEVGHSCQWMGIAEFIPSIRFSMSFAYHLDGTALCKEVVNHVLFPVEGDVVIFKPHLTAGGGDCAMHALCGEVSNGM